MNNCNVFYTIKNEKSTEIKVKGSKFIGYIKPVNTVEEAEKYIDLISSENYDATHNCAAYKVGMGDKAVYRYNDDGEPSGTGGRPILDAMEAQQLTNTVGVVTRYFGGTKLGTGGLSRAYRNCTEQTILKAGKRKIYLTDILSVNFAYELTGKVMELVEKFKCKIISKNYGADAELKLKIKQSQSEEFKQLLFHSTGGKIIIKEENAST